MCETRERMIDFLNKKDWLIRKEIDRLNKRITELLIELNEIDGKLQNYSRETPSDK